MTTKSYKIRQYGKQLKKIGQSRDAGYVAVIGKLDGTVLVGSGNLIYVTTIPEGQTRQVINRRVPNNPGDMVFVGKDGLSANKTEVLYSFNVTGSTNDGISPSVSIVPPHSHSYPGSNTTWVFSGQFMPLNCLPIAGSLTVRVYPGVIRKVGSDGWAYIAEQVVDLSGDVPGSGALWVTLQANDDGSVDYVVGSGAASRDALDETDIPEATTGRALFAIILESGFGELQRNSIRDDFLDLRFGQSGGLVYIDASDVGYTPVDITDWDYLADPGDVQDALDQLADRAATLEAEQTSVDISDDAANISGVNFLEQASVPAAPGTGHWLVYATAAGISVIDDAGNVTGPFGAGGGSGKIVQQVSTIPGTSTTGSTVMPLDDTVPQSSEGDQYMSLAITPISATNYLEITVTIVLSCNGVDFASIALFQDSIANALAAVPQYFGANESETITFKHRMLAGTTSATTFKVRAGSNGGSTLTFNGRSGARLYGGVSASSIVINEVQP